MKQVYISCPMTVGQGILDKVVRLVKDTKAIPLYWVKGSPYSEEDFNLCIECIDAFIVILPGVAWKSDVNKMTSGSRKELIKAYINKIPIFLAYENRDLEMGIYATEITKCSEGVFILSISGICSTRHTFKDIMSTNLSRDTSSIGDMIVEAAKEYAETERNVIDLSPNKSLVAFDTRIKLFF